MKNCALLASFISLICLMGCASPQTSKESSRHLQRLRIDIEVLHEEIGIALGNLAAMDEELRTGLRGFRRSPDDHRLYTSAAQMRELERIIKTLEQTKRKLLEQYKHIKKEYGIYESFY